MTKKITYLLLPFIYLLTIFICAVFSYNKGITPDTGEYFYMAKSFPEIVNNIFPFFYPFLIKLVSCMGVKIFTASKIIGIISYLIIVFVCFKKQFFTKEILLVLGLKIFTIFYFSWSETLFISLFIIFIYVFYLFEKKKISENKFIFYSSLLLFLLFITRYSGLFILISFTTYQLWTFIKEKKINYSYIKTTILSVFSIIPYLVFNYIKFGNLFGDRSKFALKNTEGLISQIKNTVISLSHAFNPFYTEIDYSEAFIRISIFVSLFFLLLILFQLYKIKNWILKYAYYRFLITIAVVYFLLILITNLNTKIDGLNFRLLLPSIFIIYFLIIVNYLEQKKPIYLIYILICLSLMINTASVIPSL